MAHVETLLAGLSYPEPVPDIQSFNTGYRTLVSWLENQKVGHFCWVRVKSKASRLQKRLCVQIRQLAQQDRAGLADLQSDSWPQAFSQARSA